MKAFRNSERLNVECLNIVNFIELQTSSYTQRQESFDYATETGLSHGKVSPPPDCRSGDGVAGHARLRVNVDRNAGVRADDVVLVVFSGGSNLLI